MAAPVLANEPIEMGAGRVVTVHGKATIKRKVLHVGDSIKVGEVIETAKDTYVKLWLRDRSIIDIGPLSSFHIDEFKLGKIKDRAVELTVDHGRVRSYVHNKLNDKGKFHLRTKTSVLAVRGTEFLVNSSLEGDGSKDTITVLEGKVAVDHALEPSQKEVLLIPGHQLTTDSTPMIQQDNAPSMGRLTSLSAKEAEQTGTAYRVQDNTFKESVTLKPTAEKEEGLKEGTLEHTITSTVQTTVLAKADEKVKAVEPIDIYIPGSNETPTQFAPVQTPTDYQTDVNTRIRIE